MCIPVCTSVGPISPRMPEPKMILLNSSSRTTSDAQKQDFPPTLMVIRVGNPKIAKHLKNGPCWGHNGAKMNKTRVFQN